MVVPIMLSRTRSTLQRISRDMINQQFRANSQKVVIFKQNQTEYFSRRLGLLETMYHNLHLKDSDVYIEYFEFKTDKLLTEKDLNAGLSMWIKRHPWLRATLKDNGSDNILNRYHIFEVPEVTTEVLNKVQCSEEELVEVSRDHFKEIMDNIGKTPLWRLIEIEPMGQISVNEGSNQNFNTNCIHKWLLVHHHMIADGIYIWTLLSDLLLYLKHAQEKSLCLEDVEEIQFPPAIEHLLPHEGESKLTLLPLVSQCKREVYALEAYESKFSDEILSLKNLPETTLHKEVTLNCDQTKKLLELCRRNGTTITGLSLAVAASAFVMLVKDCLSPFTTTVVIPIIYTVDLRRYISDKDFWRLFPGCASLHMPLQIRVNIPHSNDANITKGITDTAFLISSKISRVVKNKEPVKLFRDIIHHDLHMANSNKKDPYVIYFSNAMNMDNVVTSNKQNALELRDLKVMTNVGAQNMPVFATVAWTRGGRFTLKSHTAANYTSMTTHSIFNKNIDEIFEILIVN